MCVGTFSGVTSPGIVISSARGGTERGNSSPTSARIIDVFPHCAGGGGGRGKRERELMLRVGERERERGGAREKGRWPMGVPFIHALPPSYSWYLRPVHTLPVEVTHVLRTHTDSGFKGENLRSPTRRIRTSRTSPVDISRCETAVRREYGPRIRSLASAFTHALLAR